MKTILLSTLALILSFSLFAQKDSYLKKEFKQFEFRINSIDVNKNDSQFIIGGENKLVVVYDMLEDKAIVEFEAHFLPVVHVQFSTVYDGFYTIGDRSFKLWTNNYEKPERVYTGPNTSLTDWATTVKEDIFVAGSYDKKLRVWQNSQLDTPFTTENIHDKSIISVAISNTSKLIATASLDNTIKLWNQDSLKHLLTLQGHTKAISCLEFVNNGQHLLSAANDGYIKLWNCANGKITHLYKGHTKAISSIDISPNGKFMLTASYDNTINLYTIYDGKKIYTFEHHSAPVTNIAWNSKGDEFYSCDKEGNVLQWSVPSKLFIEFYFADKLNEEMQNSRLFKPKQNSESNKEYKEREEKAAVAYTKLIDKYTISFNEFIQNMTINN